MSGRSWFYLTLYRNSPPEHTAQFTVILPSPEKIETQINTPYSIEIAMPIPIDFVATTESTEYVEVNIENKMEVVALVGH